MYRQDSINSIKHNFTLWITLHLELRFGQRINFQEQDDVGGCVLCMSLLIPEPGITKTPR